MGKYEKEIARRTKLCKAQLKKNKNRVRRFHQDHISKFTNPEDLKHNQLVVTSLRQILLRKINPKNISGHIHVYVSREDHIY